MSEKKRIRIVSNGYTNGGTKVFIDDEDVSGSLAHVAWSIGANERSRATLTFYPAELQVDFVAASQQGEWRPPASESATVVPSEYFDDLAADLDAPDEPNERTREAAKRLRNLVRREDEVS